ncbi:MAG: hypothetical protein L0287_21885 [Anaerolineae bacterium]|nr:hypothetical protein [Anaerolineae bacterium]MCI0608690.1 hypothetical protein [Anaerolineae bacterium]
MSKKQDQIMLKVRKGITSLMALALVLGMNFWTRPSQVAMQVPDGPEVTHPSTNIVPDAPDTVPDGPE